MVSLMGRRTAMTRWAVSFRSSRRQCSRKPYSTTLADLGHADALAEITDGPGGIAPAAQAAEGGHPGIVPAGDPAFLHQLAELALAHHRVVDAKAGKLDLPGMGRQVAVLDHPVVQGAVGLKFQRAQAVGNALQRVLNGMGEVIHGIDAPLVPLAVMVHVVDPVDHRVPHIEVAAGQVDLGPQGHGAVGELPVPASGQTGPGSPQWDGPGRETWQERRCRPGVHVNSSGVSSHT